MSDHITLRLKVAPDARVMADVVAPDRFSTLSNREIGALPVWLSCATRDGNAMPRHAAPLGELFDIRGERASTVQVSGDLRAIDRLGADMGGGILTIEGDAGVGVGYMMRGGAINLSGSAGSDAGLAMAGGTLTIGGSAGDRLGGPLPGASRGMTGGEIFVNGSAGREAASAVRRGLVVVGGDAVDAGRAMIAGTLIVGGAITGTIGQWNKRGSIIAIGGATVPPTYRYACSYRPPYLRVLFQYLRSRAVPVDGRIATGRYARYCGDISQVGKGELLIWTGNTSH